MSDLDAPAKLPSQLFQAETLRLPLRSDIREVPLPLEAAVRVAAQSTDAGFAMRRLARPRAIPGIAEGDSWFDSLPNYFEEPLHGDLLGHLNARGKVNVFKIAKAGDTLESSAAFGRVAAALEKATLATFP